jgi:hypothetical protein
VSLPPQLSIRYRFNPRPERHSRRSQKISDGVWAGRPGLSIRAHSGFFLQAPPHISSPRSTCDFSVWHKLPRTCARKETMFRIFAVCIIRLICPRFEVLSTILSNRWCRLLVRRGCRACRQFTGCSSSRPRPGTAVRLLESSDPATVFVGSSARIEGCRPPGVVGPPPAARDLALVGHGKIEHMEAKLPRSAFGGAAGDVSRSGSRPWNIGAASAARAVGDGQTGLAAFQDRTNRKGKCES